MSVTEPLVRLTEVRARYGGSESCGRKLADLNCLFKPGLGGRLRDGWGEAGVRKLGWDVGGGLVS